MIPNVQTATSANTASVIPTFFIIAAFAAAAVAAFSPAATVAASSAFSAIVPVLRITQLPTSCASPAESNAASPATLCAGK